MARILYIEDDPVQRELLAQMLLLFGFEVDTAENGQQGIEKAMALLPDLILTDSYMPGISGYEAIRAIREKEMAAEIPIITLSASGGQGDSEAAIAAGADEVFVKPVDINQFVRRIRILLG